MRRQLEEEKTRFQHKVDLSLSLHTSKKDRYPPLRKRGKMEARGVRSTDNRKDLSFPPAHLRVGRVCVCANRNNDVLYAGILDWEGWQEEETGM